MTRLSSIATILSQTPLLLAAALSCAPSTTQEGSAEGSAPRLQPNILVIVLDDLGTDKLCFYGESDSPTWAAPPYCGPLSDPMPYPLTPNLEQLANGRFPGLSGGAIRFDRAYAAPLCTMARGCLQTGRYGFRNGLGVVDDGGGLRKRMSNDEVLLPELLKRGFPPPTSSTSLRPYRAGAFGKWHLSALPVCDAALASDFSHPVDNGFDLFQGTMTNVGTPRSNPGDHFSWTKVTATPGSTELTRYQVGSEPLAGPFRFSPGCTLPGTLIQTTNHSAEQWNTSVTRRDAVRWINAQEQPFFAYVAFNAPHFPYQVPPFELLSQATREGLQNPANCGGPYCAGQKPGEASSCGASSCDDPDADECEGIQQRVFFNAAVEAVDAEIGNLLAQMSPSKLRDTLVFVIGDNGTPGVVTEPLLHDFNHGKGGMYELSVRVPMITAGFLIPDGAHTSDALVHAVDLWRTLAQVTGAKESLAAPLAPLDSVGFRKILEHPEQASIREEVFCQGFVRPGPYEPTEWGPYVVGCPDPTVPGVHACVPKDVGAHGRSLRDDRFKLIVTQISAGAEGTPPGSPDLRPEYAEELYDLQTDPEEATDLMPLVPADPELAAIRAGLRARITQLSGY